jgi:hypothetical protein
MMPFKVSVVLERMVQSSLLLLTKGNSIEIVERLYLPLHNYN